MGCMKLFIHVLAMKQRCRVYTLGMAMLMDMGAREVKIVTECAAACYAI